MKIVLALLFIMASLQAAPVSLGFQFEKWPNERDVLPGCLRVSADSVIASERKPVQILYVIDISQETIGELKQAHIDGVKKLSEKLQEDDLFGVVLYSEYPRLLFPLSEMTESNRENLLSVIDGVNNENGRDLGKSLAIIEEQFSLKAGLEYENRALFLSVHGPILQGKKGDELRSLFATSAINLQYDIFTLGFGDLFSEELLIGLAEESNGEAYYVDERYPESTNVWVDTFVTKVAHPSMTNVSITIDVGERTITSGAEESLQTTTFKVATLAEGEERYLFFTIASSDSAASQDVDVQYSLKVKGGSSIEDAILSELPAGSEEVRYDSLYAPYIISNSILTNLASYSKDLKMGDKAYRRSFCDGFRQKVLFPLKSVRDQNQSEEMKKVYEKIEYLWEGLRESADSDINGWLKKINYLLHSNRFGR